MYRSPAYYCYFSLLICWQAAASSIDVLSPDASELSPDGVKIVFVFCCAPTCEQHSSRVGVERVYAEPLTRTAPYELPLQAEPGRGEKQQCNGQGIIPTLVPTSWLLRVTVTVCAIGSSHAPAPNNSLHLSACRSTESPASAPAHPVASLLSHCSGSPSLTAVSQSQWPATSTHRFTSQALHIWIARLWCQQNKQGRPQL